MLYNKMMVTIFPVGYIDLRPDKIRKNRKYAVTGYGVLQSSHVEPRYIYSDESRRGYMIDAHVLVFRNNSTGKRKELVVPVGTSVRFQIYDKVPMKRLIVERFIGTLFVRTKNCLKLLR